MRKVSTYDEDFKKMAVQKVLSPGAASLLKVAESLGIPEATLYGWKQKYGSVGVMKKLTSKAALKKVFSPEEKLQAIINKSLLSGLNHRLKVS